MQLKRTHGGRSDMIGPIPEPSDARRPQPVPGTQDDMVRALSDLHRQMIELNARLEYLHLVLKLGLR
jgi:hypothetical protein